MAAEKALTMNDTTSDMDSIVESFKHRSKSYFNPLHSGNREILVNVPEKTKNEL